MLQAVLRLESDIEKARKRSFRAFEQIADGMALRGSTVRAAQMFFAAICARVDREVTVAVWDLIAREQNEPVQTLLADRPTASGRTSGSVWGRS